MKKAEQRTLKGPFSYLLVLSALLAALFLAARFPEFIERYYSGFVYIGVSAVTQFTFNSVPFSVGDSIYVLLIGAMIYAAVRIIVLFFQKKLRIAISALLKLVVTFQLLIVVFYLFWGLNYFREPASKRFGMEDSCCYVSEIKLITQTLVDSANYYRSLLTEKDLHPPDRLVYAAAGGAIRSLVDNTVYFRMAAPRVKPSLLNWFTNYMGTAGYYNPLTSEAQINSQIPVYIRPFTSCHELSHQLGLASEDEASFAGFLACANAPDNLFKYSAYYSGLGEFMVELRLRDTLLFKEIRDRISSPVLADFKAEREYWMSYRGRAGILSSLMYDNYLKLNNQPKGLKTYNQVVRLLAGWHRKRRTFKLP